MKSGTLIIATSLIVGTIVGTTVGVLFGQDFKSAMTTSFTGIAFCLVVNLIFNQPKKR